MLYSGRVSQLGVKFFLFDFMVYVISSFSVGCIKFLSDLSVISISAYLIMLCMIGIVFLGLLYLSGNYETSELLQVRPQIYFRSLIYSAAFFYVLSFYLRSVSYSRIYFTVFFSVNFVLAILVRFIIVRSYASKLGDEAKLPLVAIGFKTGNDSLHDKLVQEMKLRIVAYTPLTTDVEDIVHRHLEQANILGLQAQRDLGMLVYEEQVGTLEPLISYCELNYIPLYIIPSVSRLLSIPLKTINYQGILIFGPQDLIVDGVSKRLKRVMDVILAIMGLILTSWLLGIIWMIVKLNSSGPAIFAQERLGLDGKRVRIYKFRTMVVDSERQLMALLENEEINKDYYDNYKIENDPRITPLGRYLRKLSLDELPQLINILKGDLSFVGPRPIVPEEIKRYGAHGNMILRVKPGLTGLWQVNGRNDVSYEERIQLDLYYIHNWSLTNDFKIILQTIPAVIQGRGAI
ncbi:Undecaprenyl-phosphate galactose phosphotransferase, WbaP/exopolysaccharide biosynthesis polyprenyl glycosylphosphotransferase [Desulfosporosinus hippei DSM 8344]|uniref:Undecaprenyl-phosphate galactose phosphotransferase, WbaP/exopolysaccharide biosynthesis polyprenyl glycosylphosphotransferase n=2 Tax=Desulfosporosinus TaxID=79206 RepID=A0A1G7U5K2_9FIRM|nr:Undecaprenyl-phosphate galactose phosphotransferase, WbaP/exopolysaccharide biosynthesis polyprenyl glycosylphosphotransferase [Desulfosporosinus hippei DSM 8344]